MPNTLPIRHLLFLGAIGSVAMVACFGAGPDPGPSATDRVTPIGTAIVNKGDQKSLSFYGSVVQDDTHLYAFVEQNNNGAIGDVPLVAMNKSGGLPEQYTTEKASGLRLAIAGRDLYWISATDCAINTLDTSAPANRKTLATLSFNGSPKGCSAIGIVADDTSVWVAVDGKPSVGGSDNSSFDPCCDANGRPPSGMQSELWQIGRKAPFTATKITVEIQPECSIAKQCLWGGTAALFWFEGPSPLTLRRFLKTGTTPWKDIAKIDAGLPVGLALTATRVVWATSVTSSTKGAESPGCRVSSMPVDGTGSVTNLYDDSTVACRDVVASADHAYFTMLGLNAQACDTCGGNNVQFQGIGIARVPLGGGAAPTVLSIARADFAARRLELDNNAVMAIDPFRIARVPRDLFPP